MDTLNIIIEWISNNKAFVVTAIGLLWEFIFRRVITDKDWSIINLIARLFDSLVKNKKTGGGFH